MDDLTRLGAAYGLGLFARKIPSTAGIVRFALTVIKLFGLFHIARYITRDGLRIICYHGFAVAEELASSPLPVAGRFPTPRNTR